MIFEFRTSVKMYDTDAAGILFFGNQFRLVEDAYEAFLDLKGFPLIDFLEKTSYIMPVVQAETSYRVPLRVSDKIVIRLDIKKVGKTSFILGHEIYKEDGVLAGEGKTVHVCIDKKTGLKVPIPQELHDIFNPI